MGVALSGRSGSAKRGLVPKNFIAIGTPNATPSKSICAPGRSPKPASLPYRYLSGDQHEWIFAGASRDTIIHSVFDNDIEVEGHVRQHMRGGPLLGKVYSG